MTVHLRWSAPAPVRTGHRAPPVSRDSPSAAPATRSPSMPGDTQPDFHGGASRSAPAGDRARHAPPGRSSAMRLARARQMRQRSPRTARLRALRAMSRLLAHVRAALNRPARRSPSETTLAELLLRVAPNLFSEPPRTGTLRPLHGLQCAYGRSVPTPLPEAFPSLSRLTVLWRRPGCRAILVDAALHERLKA